MEIHYDNHGRQEEMHYSTQVKSTGEIHYATQGNAVKSKHESHYATRGNATRPTFKYRFTHKSVTTHMKIRRKS